MQAQEETQQERAMAKYAVDDGENIVLSIQYPGVFTVIITFFHYWWLSDNKLFCLSLAILMPTFFIAFESPHLLQVMSGIVKLFMIWHVTVRPSVYFTTFHYFRSNSRCRWPKERQRMSERERACARVLRQFACGRAGCHVQGYRELGTSLTLIILIMQPVLIMRVPTAASTSSSSSEERNIATRNMKFSARSGLPMIKDEQMVYSAYP